MELINNTFLVAGINTGTPNPLNKERRAALVVAKATFKETMPGAFEPDTDSPHPLYPADQETELGVLPRDDFPKFNNGVDVIVLGKAYAPGDKPCTSMTVSLQIGITKHHLKVFGDRFWEKTNQGLRISKPEPFLTMPMDYKHAFGGEVQFEFDDEQLAMYYPHNFIGKGYIRDEEKAEGTPLPNIEHPQELIHAWDDQPLPACWATMPLNSPVHGQRGVELEVGNIHIKPEFYCRAHPDLVLNQLNPGQAIAIQGMTPDAPFAFQVPSWSVSAFCRVGEQHQEQKAYPDTLVILPEERRFYLVYRFWLDFMFKPEMRRAVRLQVDMQDTEPHTKGGIS